MKKQRKALILGSVAVVAAILAWLAWSTASRPAPQFITMPNGERFELFAVAWGTNHEIPTFANRLVGHLPAAAARNIHRHFDRRFGLYSPVTVYPSGLRATPPQQPSLQIWLRSKNTNMSAALPGGFGGVLTDDHGVREGSGGSSSFGAADARWVTLSFPSAPRRSANLVLSLEDLMNQGSVFTGRMTFRNPRFGRFPQWQPEPLPAVKTAGDLQVRLSDFSTSLYNFWFRSLASLNFNSPGGTNVMWVIHSAELSDATGNHLPVQGPLGQLWGSPGKYQLGHSMWPDEQAWRLKLNLKRGGGFDPGETVTFDHVPVPQVGARSTAFITNTIDGVPLVLKLEFWRQANVSNFVFGQSFRGTGIYTQIVLEVVNKKPGIALDFVKLTADTGWASNEHSEESDDFSRAIYLPSMPTNIAIMNVTWTVQKLRSVEFMVKPNLRFE